MNRLGNYFRSTWYYILSAFSSTIVGYEDLPFWAPEPLCRTEPVKARAAITYMLISNCSQLARPYKQRTDVIIVYSTAI